jgi:hypothetical protein
MKKTLVSALTTALVVGAASTTFAAANPFSDVPADHWAYDSVSKLASEGVINGYTDGSFEGNSTMSRYEMAQIVAKAMANQEKVNADQKAMIDKLAAEFSDELASLGVRVANLEAKTDNVKWVGWVRYDYKQAHVEKSTRDDHTQKMSIEMNPIININDHWNAYFRLNAETDMKTNSGDDNSKGDQKVRLNRLWAEGKYDNFTVKLGKINAFGNETHGLVLDDAFSGVEVDFGKTVQGTLRAGRLTDTNAAGNTTGATMLNAAVRYVGDKWDVGTAYTKLNDVDYFGNTDNSTAVWELGAGYKFDNKWYAYADYARATVDVDGINGNKADYRAAVKYGKQDINVPGSFYVQAIFSKRNYGSVSHFGNMGDWTKLYDNASIIGWSLQSEITLAKNIKTELGYTYGREYATGNKANIFWSQLQFVF